MKKILVSLCIVIMTCCPIFASQWIQEGTKWKYEKNGRILKNEWQFIDSKYYHFDDQGYMQTGLVDIEGSVYYFLPDGVGTRGEVKIGNKTYKVGERGKVLKLPDDFNLQEYFYNLEDKEKERIEKEESSKIAASELAELDKQLKEKADENAKVAANESAFLNQVFAVDKEKEAEALKKQQEQNKILAEQAALKEAMKLKIENRKNMTHMYNCEDSKGKKKIVSITVEIPILTGQNAAVANKILETKGFELIRNEAEHYVDEKEVFKPIELKCKEMQYVNDKLAQFIYTNKDMKDIVMSFDTSNGNIYIR